MVATMTKELDTMEQKGSLWELTRCSRVTTFIGAGGKTTCLNSLSAQIYQAGYEVIATTTTKVFPMCFNIWKSPFEGPPIHIGNPCFWYAELDQEMGKWIGPSKIILEEFIQNEANNRFWVIEGDGARGKKLKLWEAHEPQIPLMTECAVLIIHGDLVGNRLKEEDIHRFEKCPQLVGSQFEGIEIWNYVLRSPVFSRTYKHMNWVILFCDYKGMPSFDLGELVKTDIEKLQIATDLNKPVHLRVAAGNPNKGELKWYDLW